MRLLSKHGCQYIHLEIVCQQANYEPKYEEIYHHFVFPTISQRWACRLNMRSCSEENHSQPWVVSLEDGSACHDPRAPWRTSKWTVHVFSGRCWADGASASSLQQEGRVFVQTAHRKGQQNIVGWWLGQRSLCCPEHLSFHSLEIHLKAQMNPL